MWGARSRRSGELGRTRPGTRPAAAYADRLLHHHRRPLAGARARDVTTPERVTDLVVHDVGAVPVESPSVGIGAVHPAPQVDHHSAIVVAREPPAGKSRRAQGVGEPRAREHDLKVRPHTRYALERHRAARPSTRGEQHLFHRCGEGAGPDPQAPFHQDFETQQRPRTVHPAPSRDRDRAAAGARRCASRGGPRRLRALQVRSSARMGLPRPARRPLRRPAPSHRRRLFGSGAMPMNGRRPGRGRPQAHDQRQQRDRDHGAPGAAGAPVPRCSRFGHPSPWIRPGARPRPSTAGILVGPRRRPRL